MITTNKVIKVLADNNISKKGIVNVLQYVASNYIDWIEDEKKDENYKAAEILSFEDYPEIFFTNGGIEVDTFDGILDEDENEIATEKLQELLAIEYPKMFGSVYLRKGN